MPAPDGNLRLLAELFQAPEAFEGAIREAGGYLAVALYNTYTLFKPQTLILTGKATGLEPFTKSAVSLLKEENLDIQINPEISAAYGAAVESMKSAIKSFVI